jgi:DNA-binding IclR family transcriptional regulator
MKSLGKIRDVLLIVTSAPGAGLAEIVKKVALPKSTVFRLLGALQRNGFIARADEGRGYQLGPFLSQLASGPNSIEKLLAIARPRMVALRDKCDETVALHVLEGQSWMAIDQVESTQELRRTITSMKVPMPLHAAAPGKLFLAFMPAEEQQAYLSRHELRRFTPATITSRKRLAEEVSEVRKQGYATSFQELAIGVGSVSMPVRDPDGRVSAALGVSGPLSRFTPKAIAGIRGALRVTCQEIERELHAARGRANRAEAVFRSDAARSSSRRAGQAGR